MHPADLVLDAVAIGVTQHAGGHQIGVHTSRDGRRVGPNSLYRRIPADRLHNPTGVQLSLVKDLPKPSPPARSSPPTTASATTRSTAAAASPCATTAGLVLSLKLTLTGRPQCRSHAMPSLSQSLSVLASYSELLTSKLVTGLLPLLVLSSAPGRATRPPDPGSRLCGTARRGLAATRPGRFRRAATRRGPSAATPLRRPTWPQSGS
jgi:hypothetical protein